MRKHLFSKVITLICTFSLAFTAAFSMPGNYEASNGANNYWRNTLTTFVNGANLVGAYDVIVDAMEDYTDDLTPAERDPSQCGEIVDIEKFYLTYDEIILVTHAIYIDHPEFFWYAGSFSRYYRQIIDDVSYIVSIDLCYYIFEDIKEAKNNFDEKVTELLMEINSSDGDYQKELFIHDYLIMNNVYDINSPYNQSAYSALTCGATVCAGFTQAFKVLMDKLGIECLTITGVADGENHAWSEVKIDGKWYNTDVTWDQLTYDSGEIDVIHNYFNLPDDTFYYVHSLTGENAALFATRPKCTDDKYQIMYAENLLTKEEIQSMNPIALAKYFGESYCDGRHKFMMYDSDDFIRWLSNVGRTYKMGGGTYQLYYQHELALYLLGPNYFQRAIYGSFERMKSSAIHEVRFVYPEKFAGTQNDFVFVPGDMNMDGKVDIDDAFLMSGNWSLNYSDENAIYSDSFIPTLYDRDVDGNGQINEDDAARLLYHSLYPEDANYTIHNFK